MPLNPIQCRKKLKLKAKIASVLGSCCTCLAFAGGRESEKRKLVGGWLVGVYGGPWRSEVSLRLAARQHLPRNDFQKRRAQLARGLLKQISFQLEPIQKAKFHSS